MKKRKASDLNDGITDTEIFSYYQNNSQSELVALITSKIQLLIDNFDENQNSFDQEKAEHKFISYKRTREGAFDIDTELANISKLFELLNNKNKYIIATGNHYALFNFVCSDKLLLNKHHTLIMNLFKFFKKKDQFNQIDNFFEIAQSSIRSETRLNQVIESMWLNFSTEVKDRLFAEDGTRQFSLLSIFLKNNYSFEFIKLFWSSLDIHDQELSLKCANCSSIASLIQLRSKEEITWFYNHVSSDIKILMLNTWKQSSTSFSLIESNEVLFWLKSAAGQELWFEILTSNNSYHFKEMLACPNKFKVVIDDIYTDFGATPQIQQALKDNVKMQEDKLTQQMSRLRIPDAVKKGISFQDWTANRKNNVNSMNL
ncbi:MAG: hypothetical protein J0G32_03380 [Alphaproteobacteria bacterium]|nr:hypothetical protein [Alphaproteobacteria bacterium]OJV11930.1 MAG: hypothetical protein BGO27_00490 [Alphaproteobacteria bacterium 33-17]